MAPYRAWATAGEAYRFVFGNLRDLLVLAALPALVNIAVMLGVFWFSGAMSMARGGPPDAGFASSFLLVIVTWFVLIAIYVMFAVAWHRHYLIGSRPNGIFAVARWQRWHWRFARHGLLLGVLFLGIGMVLMWLLVPTLLGLVSRSVSPGAMFTVFFPLSLAIYVLVYYLLSRFLLAFPAASVDDDAIGLAASWELTRGRSWRFFLALVLAAVPPYLATWIVQLAISLPFAPDMTDAGSAIPDSVLIVLTATVAIQQIGTFLALALTTTAASITYRTLKAIDEAGRAAEHGESPA